MTEVIRPDAAVMGAALIAGQPLLGCQETGFQALNPATDQYLPGFFPQNDASDVAVAVAAAQTAFEDYQALSDRARADFLISVAEALEADRDQIVQRACLESALPALRINGELSRTTGQIMLFANLLKEGSWVGATIDRADPLRQPLPKPDLRMMQVPLGPVAVFGASNFPLAFSVAGGDTASALASGCPVVVKGHPAHPGTSELVGRAINRAIAQHQLPAGVFSLLQGSTIELGAALVQAPEIQAVGFTGSLKAGRALFDLACARPVPIPFYGELGSTNPVYLLPHALTQRAEALATAFVASLNMGCGQFCTNPGLLLAVKGDALTRFLMAVKDELQPQAAATMLTPAICKAYWQGRNQLAEQAGVTLWAEGQAASGHQAQTAVYCTEAAAFAANPILEEEVFGPCALVVQCEDEAQLLALTERLGGHLSSTLQMADEDLALAHKLSRKIGQKVGRVLFNGWPTGVEVAHAMTHGGPYPASTDSRSTSVGSAAILRWVRTLSWQNAPDALLPLALQNANPLQIWRKVEGQMSQQSWADEVC